ncbi:MAG TPA: serine/threonine-protein kinase, partial [Verrucomicrobiae bacterium]|nr:serine/threonine-protein kinase [Verrucomicrobiae bacterium]
CEALQYAHNEGVLHRDIKPDNILLDTRGRVKIADFGIAKLMAEAVAENPLTGSGASLGTPHYMAPEQIEKPNAVDHRADIYSLGVVFYEMLTGELPLGRFAAPSETSGNDPRLDEIVFQTLEKQPDRRPQSADEVRTRVETISTTPAPPDALPEPAITFKMANCYITSPEFLATWTGRLMKYHGRGDLRLDRENLTYAPNGNWNVIPLRAITQLTLGTSRVGMCHMKVLAVTFTEKDKTHRLYFVPNRGPFRSVYDTNDLVEEWFSAVQFAIKSSTGKLPPITREDLRPTPGVTPPRMGIPFVKGFAAFVIFLTIGVLLLNIMTQRRSRVPEKPQPAAPPQRTQSIASPTPTDSRPIKIVFVGAGNSHFYVYVTTEPTAGERFVPVIRFGDGPWGETDSVHSTPRWTHRRGPEGTNYYDQLMSWFLPKDFATDFELAAAELRTRVRIEQGPLEITPDGATLFAITNAANQVITGGIRLQKRPLQKIENPIAHFKRFEVRFNANDSSAEPRGLVGSGDINIPPGYRAQPIAREAGEEIQTTHTILDGKDRFIWPHPQKMADLKLGQFYLTKEKFELKLGEPLQIFAFTNGTGLIYEALLELIPLRAQLTSPATASASSAAPGAKTFEFTSVTNSDDYIVLQSETPLEVGKNLIALIEDSIGKTNHSVSGTIIRHTPNETHISSQLMWKMPEGSPTNWIQNTIQKIRDTIIAKPIRLAEGETMRVFQLRSTPGFVEQFASLRYESVRPSADQKSAIVHVRSASIIPSGLIFYFDAEVPPGYRLEAECDPDNPEEARMHLSRIFGKNHYNAMWTFENLRGQNLVDVRSYLTNSSTELTQGKFAIDAGQSKTIFKFKTTSGDEFPVILKLRSPYER